MTTTVTNKKPDLNLGKLSVVAQIAVKPVQPADAEIELVRIYSVRRIRKTFRNLKELVESFKLNGIIESLVMHKETDGRYHIIVGERRYRVASLAGLVKVSVIIRKGLTELQICRLQVTESNDRDDLTAYEEAMDMVEGVGLYGTREAMTIQNHGKVWVSKRMAIRHHADPACKLLENDLCGDFEMPCCPSQIYDIEDTHIESSRLSHHMNEDSPLSRGEVHSALARMKAWGQQQDDLTQRRIELDNAKKAGDKAPGKTPVRLEEQRKRDVKRMAAGADAGDRNEGGGQGPTPASAVASGRDQQALPTMEPTPEQKATTEKERANEKLSSLQEEALEWGEANQAQFSSMEAHMTMLGHSMHEIEWMLWQGFLSMTLPMPEGIGPKRAVMYLRKLRGELKDKTSVQLWKKLHPGIEGAGRNAPPDIPGGQCF